MGQPLTEENINFSYDRVTRHRGTAEIVTACLSSGDLEGLHRERHALEWEVGRAMGWFDGLPNYDLPLVWERYAELIDTLLRNEASTSKHNRAA